MRLPDYSSDLVSLADLRKELAAYYGSGVKPFAGRHHARFIPPDVPQHVISRVFQGRHLLRPCPQLNRIIGGVLAHAKRNYPDVTLFAAAFLSNHIHLMLQGLSFDVAAFIAYVKREISRRWGANPIVRWSGAMWSRYISTALPTAESQVSCLKYILSQGVKERLVAKPQQWPGVHCAKQLLDDEPLRGEWFNGTAWRRAVDAESRKIHPRPIRKEEYVETCEVTFTAIAPWCQLTRGERRTKVHELLATIEAEGRIARSGKPPLGAGAIQKTPLGKRTELPAQPWFEDRHRMICWSNPRDEQTRAYLDRYWAFQRAYREASIAFRTGKLDVQFPAGAFRPVTHAPGLPDRPP